VKTEPCSTTLHQKCRIRGDVGGGAFCHEGRPEIIGERARGLSIGLRASQAGRSTSSRNTRTDVLTGFVTRDVRLNRPRREGLRPSLFGLLAT
jgi:hypothetical protein